MIGAGVLRSFYWENNTPFCSISVYSGVQPSAATIISGWASTYFNTHLAFWSAVRLGQPNDATSDGIQLTLTTATSAVTANASGTATWAVLWPSRPTSLTSTIPSNAFMVLPAGITTTTSNVVQFENPTFVSGTSGYRISAFALTAAGGAA